MKWNQKLTNGTAWNLKRLYTAENKIKGKHSLENEKPLPLEVIFPIEEYTKLNTENMRQTLSKWLNEMNRLLSEDSYIFVVCVHMVSMLTTLIWTTNRETHSWVRLILLLPRVINSLQFLSRGRISRVFPPFMLTGLLILQSFQSC